MKIYIAGKITGDPCYKTKFDRVAQRLEMAGHIAINPATLPQGMSPADYMRICFAMLDGADAAMFLPDWEDSAGAKLERAWCEYTGKAIFSATDMGFTEKKAELCVCCGEIIPEGRQVCPACETEAGL